MVERKSDLHTLAHRDKVGVFMNFQNPKPFQNSIALLEAFIDMGLRCTALGFKDNSYFGCCFASPVDTGLTPWASAPCRP